MTTPTNQQSSWRDLSREFQYMFLYHCAMGIMFIIGGALTIALEASIAGILVIVGVGVSLHHRRQVQWRWPGIRFQNLLTALATLVFGGIFLGSATTMFPPTDPQTLPWYLAGGGIITFQVLQALRLVTHTEADFRTPPVENSLVAGAEPARTTPWWHQLVRWGCHVLFVGVWLSFVAHTYLFGLAFQNGSPVPTATQPQVIQDHGNRVYITDAEYSQIALLEVGQMGIPVVMVLTAFCHFVLGVKIVANVPTLAERRQHAQHAASSEAAGRACPACGLNNQLEQTQCVRCGTDLGPLEPPS